MILKEITTAGIRWNGWELRTDGEVKYTFFGDHVARFFFKIEGYMCVEYTNETVF